MKLIIAGSRTLNPSIDFIRDSIVSLALPDITEVVCGGARGVDEAGRLFARRWGIPVALFTPDWSVGKKAGPLRNAAMAKHGDALLLIWDGTSKGSKSMKTLMESTGKPVYEIIL